MRNSTSLKQEFLKKWIKGLQVCNSSSEKKMTILERKKAIKMSADIAMASTRNGTTCWSRAVVANATQSNRVVVERILGPHKPSRSVSMVMHKKILKKSRRVCSSRSRRVLMRKRDVAKTHSIAKRLVWKKTQVLKSLVPGGEFMEDEMCLIAETLDYIVSLRAQVDVMRCLATTTELINGK
ncbi:PREDICTED: mRNAion factor [Prunus dulcis]|uniref:PREDICTED: mRNAion factor n=1 Tax=Prunus dulcis TaxID=3755 RepID=A0A5E4EQU6_PRUDU|nr:transcription factor IBH1-like 1 [Prunus dulcis]VVA18117.1 PREDICTED: mRNAion factor [Prunus dulcis]